MSEFAPYTHLPDLVQWLIEVAGHDKEQEIMDNALVPGLLRLEVKINGVEMPFIETFSKLEKELEKLIRAGAIVLLEEKYSDIFSVLQDIEDELSDSRRAITNTIREGE